MCLSKNEIRLLRYYYSKLGDKINGRLDLNKDELIAIIKVFDTYSTNIEDMCDEKEIMQSPNFERVRDAHANLHERGLVNAGPSKTGRVVENFGIVTHKMNCVSLTLKGKDLGRKYCNQSTGWGVWWQGHFHKSLRKKLIAVGILLGVIWTVIQIYESETFKKIFHISDTKMQVPLNKTMTSNIFAEVSRGGEISKANEFPWKIKKTKNEEGDILYTIIGRSGDATAVKVIPDTPKYTVNQSHDGMVIKYSCPEEKISDFKIVLKY